MISAKTPVECTKPADIVFVLDSSTSIRKADFEKQLEFVKYFVRTLNVGQNHNQVCKNVHLIYLMTNQTLLSDIHEVISTL